MTISSMTGFARATGHCVGFHASMEIKSVNGRGLDIRVRVPSMLDGFDLTLKKQIGKILHRGSVSMNLSLVSEKGEDSLQINEDRLSQLVSLSTRMHRTTGLVSQLDGLLALPGVVGPGQADLDEDSRTALEAELLELADKALKELVESRSREGGSLQLLLEGQIDEIERLTLQVEQSADADIFAIRDRLKTRITSLLDQNGLEPDRMEQELALLTLRHDVREELDRLVAHVKEARVLLNAEGPKGRKLDFLAQEFNREANTLCSKSAGTGLTRIGLDLKAVIDQLREQVQNVE